jgi:AmmeMemoRadiSam system protein A
MLSENEKKRAKELALLSIKFEFEQDENMLKKIKEIEDELNRYAAGVFVTLKINKQLRGCIGFPVKKPLGKAIKEAAKLSAFHDPRFFPLTKDELKDIEIEITLLSKPKEIKNKEIKNIIKEIEIGKHGLIIRSNYGSGLLLPQVALEYKLDQIGFIEATCIKSGLSKNAWLNKDVKVYKFEGIWF